MMRLASTLLAVGFALTSPAAHAAQCAFTSYKPGALLNRLVERLADRGVALAPGTSFGTDGFLVVQDQKATASVNFSEDRVHGAETATFTNMDGVLLATMKLDVGVYRDDHGNPIGRESTIAVWTAIDGAEADELAPFYLIDSPAGIGYWRFNRATGVSLWRYDLRDSMTWLEEQLADSANGKAIARAPRGEFAALEQAFAMQPALIPYLGLLEFQRDRAGNLLIDGRVGSNYVYDLIVRTAMAEGFQVRPNLVIDTGFDPRRSDLPRTEACTR